MGKLFANWEALSQCQLFLADTSCCWHILSEYLYRMEQNSATRREQEYVVAFSQQKEMLVGLLRKRSSGELRVSPSKEDRYGPACSAENSESLSWSTRSSGDQEIIISSGDLRCWMSGFPSSEMVRQNYSPASLSPTHHPIPQGVIIIKILCHCFATVHSLTNLKMQMNAKLPSAFGTCFLPVHLVMVGVVSRAVNQSWAPWVIW